MKTYKCVACKSVLPETSFPPLAQGAVGRNSCCIDCFNTAVADEYEGKHNNFLVERLVGFLKFPKTYKLSERQRASSRASSLRYLARKNAAEGYFSANDVASILEKQKGRCFYCGATLHDGYHVDHVIPLSRGGSNWPSNLVCACPGCNTSKRDRLLAEWKSRT